MSKSAKFSSAVLALTALLVIGFLALEGCNKRETVQPKVSNFFVSGCNDIALYREGEMNDTIYVTTVDDTKLKISTTNTQFYCGANPIWHEIDAQEQNISIALLYEDPWSNCLCGHHVDITIENLETGKTYNVNIKKDEQDYFHFEVTFGSDINLMFIREQ